jgi:hypothetical protein
MKEKQKTGQGMNERMHVRKRTIEEVKIKLGMKR